jgi:riboflavin kinase/FMN adenylyltransferase
VHGDHRGRELGYPTANLGIAAESALPADGVYAAWLMVGSKRYPAALSVGTNPQFEGREVRVEAYAITSDDLDLYGLHAAVDLVDRVRGQAVFDSLAALTERMGEDVREVERLLGGTVSP